MIKCNNCGRENSDDAFVCYECKHSLAMPADSVESVPNAAAIGNIDSAPTAFDTYGGASAPNFYMYDKEAVEQIRLKKFGDRALILAFLGLLLDIVYGLGIIFCFISLGYAVGGYAKTKKQIFLWSIFISIAGIALAAFFFFLLIVA